MGASPPILNGLTMPLESCSHKVRERESEGSRWRFRETTLLLSSFLFFFCQVKSFLFYSISTYKQNKAMDAHT